MSCVFHHNIYIKKSVVFLCNKQSENEISKNSIYNSIPKNKKFRNKFNKRHIDLKAENFITSLEEIKDLNKWKNILCSQSMNTVKVAILPILICDTLESLSKIPAAVLEVVKLKDI